MRLLAGTTQLHRDLERHLAVFMRADDAIEFSTRYVTSLATISTLVGPDDVVASDQRRVCNEIDFLAAMA